MVVASETLGQVEVAHKVPDGIFLYPPSDPILLAQVLNRLLENPGLVERAKKANLEASKREFCWEKVAPRLVEKIGTSGCLR
jgi:glycosyltransferase involved in cell wall biosynthesis